MDSNLRRYTTKNLRRNLFWTWISTWKITTRLLIINIIAFLAYILASIFIKQDILTHYLALNPTNLFVKGYIWTLITSMFLHGGILHLFVNMLSLYFIGNFLEMLIGKKRFIWFYLISGIFAGLFFAVLAFYFGNYELGEKLFGSPEIFAVGASGAIFGIAGVLAVLIPKKRVYLVAGPLIAIVLAVLIESFTKNEQIINLFSILINIYIVFALIGLFSFSQRLRKISLPIEMPFYVLPWAAIIPLVIMGFFIVLPIGNSAHLGGLLAGLIYGFYLKNKYKNKVKIIERQFSR